MFFVITCVPVSFARCVSRATNHIIRRWVSSSYEFYVTRGNRGHRIRVIRATAPVFVKSDVSEYIQSSFIKRNEADGRERIFIHTRTIITYIFINFIQRIHLLIRFILKYLTLSFWALVFPLSRTSLFLSLFQNDKKAEREKMQFAVLRMGSLFPLMT